eukprot:CAMPEP_0113704568 /NCGR_PEP_ID=MMETSP0038_2-20120614/26596_1 /TAXON_ID=2898 /ORGANISM="Cryptomonas paramecium" /LENGTH=709 /DNA_ID=CAMNT_0000629373 /DNA_START=591 /DNA_END=2720 /DNA_ORIENTATION=- /assembly_acc=CAM_ASM_000170
MGIGPVALISSVVAQGIPACSKVCIFANRTFVDPYPICPLSKSECTKPAVLDFNPDYQNMASTVALMTGFIMVVMAPLLGWFMNFVPSPVIMGFTTGGGLIIALSQLKDIFGYKVSKDNLQSGLGDLFSHFDQTQGITCTMGLLAAAFLFVARKLGQGRILWWKAPVPKWLKQLALLPWAFGLVVLYTAISANYNLKDRGVDVVGSVPPGLPPAVVPYDLDKNIPKLISVTITITIVGYLESIAVETKFANQFKYQINPTQESIAQGWANILAGLTMAYPAVGSFSRSSTNAAYGSKSPICNLVAALVVLICLLVLTPYLYHMPKCVLAAIVVVAALALVEWEEFIYLWRTNKFEFLIMLLTFLLAAFYTLEYGIYVSVALCGFMVLFQATQPKVTMLASNRMFIYLPGATSIISQETDVKKVLGDLKTPEDSDAFFCHVEGSLIYAAAGQVKKLLFHRISILSKSRCIRRFIFDLKDMSLADSTALKALVGVLDDLDSRNIRACIVGPPKGLLLLMPHTRVQRQLSKVHIFQDMQELNESGWLTREPSEEGSVGGEREGRLMPGAASFLERMLARSSAKAKMEEVVLSFDSMSGIDEEMGVREMERERERARSREVARGIAYCSLDSLSGVDEGFEMPYSATTSNQIAFVTPLSATVPPSAPGPTAQIGGELAHDGSSPSQANEMSPVCNGGGGQSQSDGFNGGGEGI